MQVKDHLIKFITGFLAILFFAAFAAIGVAVCVFIATATMKNWVVGLVLFCLCVGIVSYLIGFDRHELELIERLWKKK